MINEGIILIQELYLADLKKKKTFIKSVFSHEVAKTEITQISKNEDKVKNLFERMQDNNDIVLQHPDAFLLKKVYMNVENYLSSMEKIFPAGYEMDDHSHLYQKELTIKKEIIKAVFSKFISPR